MSRIKVILCILLFFTVSCSKNSWETSKNISYRTLQDYMLLDGSYEVNECTFVLNSSTTGILTLIEEVKMTPLCNASQEPGFYRNSYSTVSFSKQVDVSGDYIPDSINAVLLHQVGFDNYEIGNDYLVSLRKINELYYITYMITIFEDDSDIEGSTNDTYVNLPNEFPLLVDSLNSTRKNAEDCSNSNYKMEDDEFDFWIRGKDKYSSESLKCTGEIDESADQDFGEDKEDDE